MKKAADVLAAKKRTQDVFLILYCVLSYTADPLPMGLPSL